MKKARKRSENGRTSVLEPDLEERVGAKFPIIRELKKIAVRVPKQSWNKLPRDLSAEVDHYAYGSPKR